MGGGSRGREEALEAWERDDRACDSSGQKLDGWRREGLGRKLVSQVFAKRIQSGLP